MLTKERLEELIEQGAIIYRTYADVSVQEVKLNKNYMKFDNAFLWQKMTGAFKGCGTPLEQLFETKEEAEWHKEFGCIERTERLVLPTWEEVSRDLENVSVGTYIIREFDDYIFFVLFRRSGKKEIYIRSTIGEEFWEFTKENYTLACRKAKELFLGERG